MRFFRHFVRCSLLICCIILLFLPSVSAHRGRTDSRGGHIDHSTGEYHYHHDYSAHQHTDLNGDGIPDCPYDFDDQTGSASGSSSNGSSSNGSSSSASTSAQPEDKQRYTWWGIILLVAFCILALPFGIIMFGVPIFLIALKLFSLFKNIFARIFKK